MSMEYLETKELENSLKGIELGFESINHLTDLYSSIKDSRYVLVPNNVIKTVNIALESVHKKFQIENISTISLEDKEDTTIFQRILATIKTIWKKIVETWDYIWDKIVSFFNSNRSKELEKEVDKTVEKSKIAEKEITKDYKEEDLSVSSISLSEPLRYLNKDLTGNFVYNNMVKSIIHINKSLQIVIQYSDVSYKLVESFLIHKNKMSDITKISIAELDNELFEIFFENIIKNTKLVNEKIVNEDKEILEHMLNIDGKINYDQSSCIKGFIKGGGLFFYLLEGVDDPNAKLFECLAIDKISDENNQVKLYYLPKELLVSYNQILEQKIKDFKEFEERFFTISKEIKTKHNNIRKLIDSFIKNDNIVYEQNPEDFRTKFETLKNISHSMLRFVLEISKGFSMYQDTLNYYVKYGKASLEFYEKDIKKGN